MNPTVHLHKINKKYPGAWKQLAVMRKDKGVDLPDWPAWCFLPMSGWYAIVSAKYSVQQLSIDQIPDLAHIAALGTWRYSQGIYQFDSDAAKALADTVTHGELPIDVIMRLPEWCVYIDTPNRRWASENLHGFWAHLEYDVNTQRHELRLLLNTEKMLVPQIVHLGRWTVTEAVDRWFSESRKQSGLAGIAMPGYDITADAVERLSAEINPLISLLLYLCSDEPDISNRDLPDSQPGRAKPKKTKKGWRLLPPNKPKIWHVGKSIGDTLRSADYQDSGRSVRPHLRRAHWHGYWTGPRDGEQKFRYKWLPPVVVGSDDR